MHLKFLTLLIPPMYISDAHIMTEHCITRASLGLGSTAARTVESKSHHGFNFRISFVFRASCGGSHDDIHSPCLRTFSVNEQSADLLSEGELHLLSPPLKLSPCRAQSPTTHCKMLYRGFATPRCFSMQITMTAKHTQRGGLQSPESQKPYFPVSSRDLFQPLRQIYVVLLHLRRIPSFTPSSAS